MFASIRISILAALFVTSSLAITAARAADNVPNPAYAAWASFNVGASATLSCDMKAGPNDVHLEMTRKLADIKPEAISIESTTVVTAAGHTSNPPPTKQTIKATAPAREVKEAGEAEVAAAGKTYKCKVIELTGAAAAANVSRPGAAAQNVKVTLYVNKDVPGGVVKMEIAGATTMTFLLTASEVK